MDELAFGGYGEFDPASNPQTEEEWELYYQEMDRQMAETDFDEIGEFVDNHLR